MSRSQNLVFIFLSVACASVLFIFKQKAFAGDLKSELARGFNFSGTASSVVVYDLRRGVELYSSNSDTPLKPASILKVLTSHVALEELGAGYRFVTELYSSGVSGGYADTLAVYGAGDPSFTTEDLWILARKVKASGVSKIGTIVLDDSRFVDPNKRSGQRAYQAGSSSLPLNFNSVTINVCPGRSGRPATVKADPWEGGVSIRGSIMTASRERDNFFVEESSSAPLQTYKISGRVGSSGKCREVYRSIASPTRYFGRVFESFLKYLDISVVNGFEITRKSGSLDLLYQHKSKPLDLIVRDLNNYSSNFIAEQLLSTLGCSGDGGCSRQAGVRRLSEHLEKHGFSAGSFKIEDGSGLSHGNRLTAKIVLRLLAELYHNNSFGPEFFLSLPVGERSGTLKKRKFGRNTVVRAKTGTLNGVNSLAGYITSISGKKLAFVIIQNKVSSVSQAHAKEQKLMKILYES